MGCSKIALTTLRVKNVYGKECASRKRANDLDSGYFFADKAGFGACVCKKVVDLHNSSAKNIASTGKAMERYTRC